MAKKRKMKRFGNDADTRPSWTRRVASKRVVNSSLYISKKEPHSASAPPDLHIAACGDQKPMSILTKNPGQFL
jgi:hypothetical protein